MLKAERAKHRYMGLDTALLTPKEVEEMTDGMVNTAGILGALYDPLDGHLDPYGTTHAYAKAAKMGGADIHTHTKVTATNPRPDGSWEVITDKGTVIAEHVVNAAGLWAREVAAMAGVYLPLLPMAHQYLVTDDIPEIVARGKEFPHVMDPGGESYLRQEGRGFCIGFYEQPCEPWSVDGTPWEFGQELFNEQFDKIADSVEFAYQALSRAGAQRGQAGDSRAVHLCPRWQPPAGPGAGSAQLLVGLCRDGRLQPGWRHGA